MDSIQIRKALDRLILPHSCNFIGVFARDEIPKIHKYPSCFVINSDTSKSKGTHWLAVYCIDANCFEFFDSYALSPTYYNIEIYHSKNNTKPIQSLHSSVCGQFCIYFLYHRSLGHSFNTIISSFSKFDLYWNDYHVAHFTKKLFRISNPALKRSICPTKQIAKSRSLLFRTRI